MTTQLVDSHCHLDRLELSKHDDSLDTALSAAHLRGIAQFLCVAINLENIPAIRHIAEEREDVLYSVGVHPNERDGAEPTVEQLIELAEYPKVVAIGETGLDYFRSEGELDWQRQRFRNHIEAAKLSRKPLIIHCREARDDTMRILEEEGADQVGGIMHCFVEDLQTAERAMALGFYISFSGIVTFNSAKELQEVARVIPLERMLVETDAPYLAPVPYRGKPNEPAYVYEVAERIARLRGMELEEIAEQTTENFHRLFGLDG